MAKGHAFAFLILGRKDDKGMAQISARFGTSNGRPMAVDREFDDIEAVFEESWPILEPSWTHFGTTLEHLGPS